jgi:hypothetical protein
MWENLADLSHALRTHKHGYTASALMVQLICEPHSVVGLVETRVDRNVSHI